MSIPAQGAVGAEMMTAGIGPRTITTSRKTCAGCPALQTKEWTFYGENDDIDSGTDGKCTAAGKVISGYWSERDPTPDWCPALASPRADSDERTAGEALRAILLRAKWIGQKTTAEDYAARVVFDTQEEAYDAYRALVALRDSTTPAQPAGAVPDSLRALSEGLPHSFMVTRADHTRERYRIEITCPGLVSMQDMHKALVSLQSARGQSSASVNWREALAPFVSHYQPWMDEWADDKECTTYARVTFGDLRRARTILASHPAGQSAGSGAEAHTVFDPARTTSDPYDDRPGPWYDMKKVREIEAATGIAFAVAPLERDPSRATDGLVERFAEALRTKLRAAEAKYGWQNGWLKSDWAADCQRDLMRHVGKGDPLDVAAYAAFCWHHGWPTAPDSTRIGQGEATDGWVLVPLECTVEMIRAARARAREMLGGALNALAFEDCWDAALAARPAAPEAQGAEREGFNAGYAMACANIVNLHGEDTIAENILAESGITLAEVKALDLTEYDMKPLRALFREIARKRKISKAKAAPPASSGQGGR